MQNPHDSIALARVVNSPARGIGKTTMETLERIALSTRHEHLGCDRPRDRREAAAAARAAGAEQFRRLIEDARAMLGPDFAEKLAGDLR